MHANVSTENQIKNVAHMGIGTGQCKRMHTKTGMCITGCNRRKSLVLLSGQDRHILRKVNCLKDSYVKLNQTEITSN